MELGKKEGFSYVVLWREEEEGYYSEEGLRLWRRYMNWRRVTRKEVEIERERLGGGECNYRGGGGWETRREKRNVKMRATWSERR